VSRVNLLIIHGRVRLGARYSNMRYIKRVVTETLENIDKSVDVIVLPPYPLTGPVIGYVNENRIYDNIKSSADMLSQKTVSNKTMEFLVRLARDHDVSIITGPLFERAGPRLYVTSLYIDRFGSLVAKYRKIGVTRLEREHNIHPGSEPGVFILGPQQARIGVFIDEDLAYPEIFRSLQAEGVNIILGFMLPYVSDYFKIVTDEQKKMTMDEETIVKFLEVRSRETGVPIVLVGGIVEASNHSYGAYMRTIPVEPDVGAILDKAKGPADPNQYMLVEVDIRTSRPRPLYEKAAGLCKRIYSRSARR